MSSADPWVADRPSTNGHGSDIVVEGFKHKVHQENIEQQSAEGGTVDVRQHEIRIIRS